MKSATTINNYFVEKRLRLSFKEVEIKNVYMSKDIHNEIFSDPSFGFHQENMMKENISDYTFRGLPIVIVFGGNYFEVGI